MNTIVPPTVPFKRSSGNTPAPLVKPGTHSYRSENNSNNLSVLKNEAQNIFNHNHNHTTIQKLVVGFLSSWNNLVKEVLHYTECHHQLIDQKLNKKIDKQIGAHFHYFSSTIKYISIQTELMCLCIGITKSKSYFQYKKISQHKTIRQCNLMLWNMNNWWIYFVNISELIFVFLCHIK